MPMASMAQGAANYGGENVFFEKQSTISHYVGNATVADQLKKGICLSLVLSWLASNNPETPVVASTSKMIQNAGAQGVLVHSWTGTADVDQAGRKILTSCEFWFSYPPKKFAAGKNIDHDILTCDHAANRDARFILCVQTDDYSSAHALGVWKWSNDQDVYFYDPNFGAARLPMNQFHNFLAEFIETFYDDNEEWYISGFLQR